MLGDESTIARLSWSRRCSGSPDTQPKEHCSPISYSPSLAFPRIIILGDCLCPPFHPPPTYLQTRGHIYRSCWRRVAPLLFVYTRRSQCFECYKMGPCYHVYCASSGSSHTSAWSLRHTTLVFILVSAIFSELYRHHDPATKIFIAFSTQRSLYRCLFSTPAQPIHFCDVIAADVLTSFAKVLGDIWISVLLLLPGGSLKSAFPGGFISDMAVPILLRLVVLFLEFMVLY